MMYQNLKYIVTYFGIKTGFSVTSHSCSSLWLLSLQLHDYVPGTVWYTGWLRRGGAPGPVDRALQTSPVFDLFRHLQSTMAAIPPPPFAVPPPLPPGWTEHISMYYTALARTVLVLSIHARKHRPCRSQWPAVLLQRANARVNVRATLAGVPHTSSGRRSSRARTKET